MTDKEELKKKDMERLRIKQEFEDGATKGSIIIDEVSGDMWIEFRAIARKFFGNKDGAALAGLVQLFLAEKAKQKILYDEPEKKE